MIDFSSQVGPGYGTRSLDGLIGIAVHHTASPNKAWTLAEEEAHIRAIDADHSTSLKPWGGIGYSALIFPSGNIYTMGPLTQTRAGVTHRNAELASFAFVGNFTSEQPTPEALDAGYELIDEWWQVLGQEMPVKGHRDWATADAPTACPGDTWREWILAIVAEEEPMPEVKRACKRCRVTAEDVSSGYVLVSPSGTAHHSRDDWSGMTDCGIDATGADWWWPL